MHKNILLTLLVFTLNGCATLDDLDRIQENMYNYAQSGVSEFDNTKFIRVSRMVCSNSVMFELYQDTNKHKKGIVLLNAGSKSITNIGNGNSLLVKLDGKLYSFESTDPLTEHDTIRLGYGINMQFSHKTYIVPESFVKEAANSNNFLVKMHLLNNEYIEGKCSELTLKETQDNINKLGYDLTVTQKNVHDGNKNSAINGFKKFVNLVNSTKW